MARLSVVVLRSGMVMLTRRAPDLWGFPGGEPAPGETAADAAKRFLREQFGVEGEPGDAVPGGILVTKVAGKPTPADGREIAWVEARRLLEREISPDERPAAEAVAAHRRRDRYQGTHPKTFAHKYKELAGDPEAVAKAKARGSTPAGGHVSIMVAEVLAALEPLSGAVVLDCTLGAGGHAAELARRGARVVGLDRDGEELARTRERLAESGLKVETVKTDYSGAKGALRSLGLDAVDALFADLGVSSMQLDRPERGMSFKNDGPLDMRMDRSRGETAAQWLARATAAEIADVLRRYGDEPDAERVAAVLKAHPPKTTAALASAVATAKGLGPGRVKKRDAFSAHPAARTFQALRLQVNDERHSLEALLAALPSLLKPDGRAAFLTFHSGEERLVKGALDAQAAAGVWRCAPAAPLKPSPAETRDNPRSRSARLWTVVRRPPAEARTPATGA
ncbi:MAG: 16S rRNA (cytosine(1402)-N(4))-methyltransferase RsmH [Elusimicrobia bacterium]|nr:16S rRNA (cytosine(1402)-N(4))-methyltransferase RsmH [Elusimicrobiota bacterium]